MEEAAGAASGGVSDPWRVETIDANGMRFETAMAGEGEKLALCLHGFPEHFISWRFQIPMLAARGYTVWAPNLRGYGGSSRPTRVRDYRLEALMQDVAGLFDAAAARGLKPSLLLSHDWGGIIAWGFLLNRIRPVERFIVVNMPHPIAARRGFLRGGQYLKSWYIGFFQIPWLPEAGLTANRAQRIADAFYDMAVHKENFPPEILDVYRENALRPGGLTAMINYYRANFWTLPFSDLWVGERSTDTPTLMLWGEQDSALGVHLTEGAESFISDLTLRRFPDASHWAQQDAPDAVNAAISEWLDAPRPHAA